MANRPGKGATLQRCRPDVMAVLKEFYTEKLSDKDYVRERRKEIRIIHGLHPKDPRVCKFSMVDIVKPQIGEIQVVDDRNFDFVASYLATFIGEHSLPRKVEVEETLAELSRVLKLNYIQHRYEHEAWASVEGGQHRALAGYVMNRCQRNKGVRSKQNSKMQMLKTIVREKLQEAGKLRGDGHTKVPERGRNASKESLTSGSSATELEVDVHEVPDVSESEAELPEEVPMHDQPSSTDEEELDIKSQDGDQNTSIQDRKPLTTELAEEDAELEKQANAVCAKLGEDPESRDVVKAQKTMRKAAKRKLCEDEHGTMSIQDEDQDREFRDDQSDEDNEGAGPRRRGKGKGKGKGRGRGRGKGKGKAAGRGGGKGGEEATGSSNTSPPKAKEPVKRKDLEPKDEAENVKKPKGSSPKETPKAFLSKDSGEVSNYNLLKAAAKQCGHLAASMPALPLQRKSFTVRAPEKTASSDPSAIGVLLTTAGFYVYSASAVTIKKLEDYDGLKHKQLKLNKKIPPGCSIYWNTHGGPVEAWKIAKIMARWEPAKGAPWEVSECEGEHKESEDEDSKNVD